MSADSSLNSDLKLDLNFTQKIKLKNNKNNNLAKSILIADILSQGVVLTALFPFFATENLKNILTQTPLHYFMFPFIGLTELVLLGVSIYYFCKSTNKNWQITTRLLVDLIKVSAINTAIIGSIIAPVMFAPIAPVLFVSALGLATCYHLIMSLWYTRKISRISDKLLKQQYINERKIALLNTFVLGCSVFAISFLMLNPVGGVLAIALAAAIVAVTLFNICYLSYGVYKNKNIIPVIKRQDSATFISNKELELDILPHGNVFELQDNILRIIENKLNKLNANKNTFCFFNNNKKNQHKINLLSSLKNILVNSDITFSEKSEKYKSLVLNFNKSYRLSFQSFFSYISDTAKIFLSVGYLFDMNNLKNIKNSLNNSNSNNQLTLRTITIVN